MNIGEIIREVDSVWAPNSVLRSTKCMWLSQDQWQVLRKVRLPNMTEVIETVAGMDTYPLPSDCQPDLLRHVILIGADGAQVEYHPSKESGGYWYSIAHKRDGTASIVLSAAPSTDGASLTLFYVPRPAAFADTDLTVKPMLPEDYHEYLVKKLAARCAKANAAAGGGDRDILLANNYETEAAELLEKMIREYSPDSRAGFQLRINW